MNRDCVGTRGTIGATRIQANLGSSIRRRSARAPQTCQKNAESQSVSHCVSASYTGSSGMTAARIMSTNALPTGKQNSVSLLGQGITKIYQTGSIEIQALRGVDFELRPFD